LRRSERRLDQAAELDDDRQAKFAAEQEKLVADKSLDKEDRAEMQKRD
jgi:hypothetical protein